MRDESKLLVVEYWSKDGNSKMVEMDEYVNLYKELLQERERNKVLAEALQFYADPSSWIWTKRNLQYDQIIEEDMGYCLVYSGEKIGGSKAREALYKLGEKK